MSDGLDAYLECEYIAVILQLDKEFSIKLFEGLHADRCTHDG